MAAAASLAVHHVASSSGRVQHQGSAHALRDIVDGHKAALEADCRMIPLDLVVVALWKQDQLLMRVGSWRWLPMTQPHLVPAAGRRWWQVR